MIGYVLVADNDLGWYWLSVRSYDPVLARFLQPDPSEQEGLFNYIYAGDNPSDLGDPSGLIATPPTSGNLLPCSGPSTPIESNVAVGSVQWTYEVSHGNCANGGVSGAAGQPAAPSVCGPMKVCMVSKRASRSAIGVTPIMLSETTGTGGTAMVNYYDMTPAAQASWANFTAVQAQVAANKAEANGQGGDVRLVGSAGTIVEFYTKPKYRPAYNDIRRLYWNLLLGPDARSLGPALLVTMPLAMVNGRRINPPYPQHTELNTYDFHSSMRTYTILGKGGGTHALQVGDTVSFLWQVVGPAGYDVVTVAYKIAHLSIATP